MGLDMYLNKRPKVNNNSELSEAVRSFVKWIRAALITAIFRT